MRPYGAFWQGTSLRGPLNIMRCPCLGTFLFLLRYRSVALYSGALPNEFVLPQPLQVRGIDFYVHYLFHVSPFRSAARMRLLLIVAVCRRFAEEQSRECELQGGDTSASCWNEICTPMVRKPMLSAAVLMPSILTPSRPIKLFCRSVSNE